MVDNYRTMCVNHCMTNNNYTDLNVWKESLRLVKEVYQFVKKLPKEELYGLSDQMRRAVISIPSNIAEGQRKHSRNEFIRYLNIAIGSAGELETQLLITQEIFKLEISSCVNQLNIVTKMLYALRKSIEKIKN